MKTANTRDIRETLKTIMQTEIEKLPETLESLEPKERMNVLCKIMPYVLPRTDSVKHNFGEADEHEIPVWGN